MAPFEPYPLEDLPRDEDPGGKVDFDDLERWWEGQRVEDGGLLEVIEEVKISWPETLPKDSWYIVLYSTLIACGKPATIAPLYKYLTTNATSEADLKLWGNRFKDILLKVYNIIGVVQVVTAVPLLAKAEVAAFVQLHKNTNISETELRAKLSNFLSHTTATQESPYINQEINASLRQRGFNAMTSLYRHNLPAILSTWGRHQADFEWMETQILYGVFLSNRAVLSEIETSMVVLASIMAQDAVAPTKWHLRGLRRAGVSERDADVVLEGVRSGVRWAGRKERETVGLRARDVDVD